MIAIVIGRYVYNILFYRLLAMHLYIIRFIYITVYMKSVVFRPLSDG